MSTKKKHKTSKIHGQKPSKATSHKAETKNKTVTHDGTKMWTNKIVKHQLWSEVWNHWYQAKFKYLKATQPQRYSSKGLCYLPPLFQSKPFNAYCVLIFMRGELTANSHSGHSVPCECFEPQLKTQPSTHSFLPPHSLLPGRSQSGLHQVWDPWAGTLPRMQEQLRRPARGFVWPCADRKNTWEWGRTWTTEVVAKQTAKDWALASGRFFSTCDEPRSLSKSGGWCLPSLLFALAFSSKSFSFTPKKADRYLQNNFVIDLLQGSSDYSKFQITKMPNKLIWVGIVFITNYQSF